MGSEEFSGDDRDLDDDSSFFFIVAAVFTVAGDKRLIGIGTGVLDIDNTGSLILAEENLLLMLEIQA